MIGQSVDIFQLMTSLLIIVLGALGPRIDHVVVQLSPEETLGAYTIFGASTSVESMHIDQTTVDIVASYDGGTTSLSDKFRRLRSQTIRL